MQNLEQTEAQQRDIAITDKQFISSLSEPLQKSFAQVDRAIKNLEKSGFAFQLFTFAPHPKSIDAKIFGPWYYSNLLSRMARAEKNGTKRIEIINNSAANQAWFSITFSLIDGIFKNNKREFTPDNVGMFLWDCQKKSFDRMNNIIDNNPNK
jgi:hypothetical protein